MSSSPEDLRHTGGGTLLGISSLSRVVAVLLAFGYVSDSVDFSQSFGVPKVLFYMMSGATAILLLLQRPWAGKNISSRQGTRIGISGGLFALTMLLWLFGMRGCGPLRALLMDGSELPLFYILALAAGRESPSRGKTRGAILMLLAYVLLIYDASGNAPKGTSALEKTKFGKQVEQSVEQVRAETHETMDDLRDKADDALERLREKNIIPGGEEQDVETVEEAAAKDDKDDKDDKGDKDEQDDKDDDKDDKQAKEDMDKDEGAGPRRRLLSPDARAAPTTLQRSVTDGKTGARRQLRQARDDKNDKDDEEDEKKDKDGDDGPDEGDAKEEAGGDGPGNDADDGDDDETMAAPAGGLTSELGVVLVLCASLVNQWSRGFTRKLATELGGAKRQFALTVTSGTVALAPLMVLSEMMYKTRASDTELGDVLALFAIGFLWLVLPYYVRSAVASSVTQRTTMRSGMMFTFVIATVAWIIFGAGSRAGGMSVTLLASFALLLVGINLMTNSSPREASSLPFDRREERSS